MNAVDIINNAKAQAFDEVKTSYAASIDAGVTLDVVGKDNSVTSCLFKLTEDSVNKFNLGDALVASGEKYVKPHGKKSISVTDEVYGAIKASVQSKALELYNKATSAEDALYDASTVDEIVAVDTNIVLS